MAIEELEITFIDGSTVISAGVMNPIIGKINEAVRKVNDIDEIVSSASHTQKKLIVGDSSNLSHGHVSVHGLSKQDLDCPSYLAEEGEYVVLHAVPEPGFQFSKWDEDNSVQRSRTILVSPETENGTTLTAVFVGSTVTITPSTDDASKGTVSGGGTVEIGESVTLVASAAQFYRFKEWQKNGVKVSESASYTFNAGSEDATYTAVFEALPIGDIEFQTEKVEGGIKITSVSAENANLIEISVNGSSYGSYHENMVINETSTISFKASNSITNVTDVETGGIIVTYDADEDTVTVKAAAVMYYNTTGSPTEESTSVTANTDLTLETGNTYYILSAGRNYEVEVIDDSQNS